MKDYKDLELWKEARTLVSMIYKISAELPSEEKYGLKSQIQRAAISVPSNIAEGMGRSTPADTLRFMVIARGSLFELETQLILALDLEMIDKEKLTQGLSQIQLTLRLLNGYVTYLRNSKS